MYDVFTEAACLSILAALVAYIIISWGNMPEEVPMHYNAAGEITGTGGKDEVIFLPIIAVFIYLLLTLVGRFPQLWNTGVKVTDENRERIFRILKNLLNTLKLILILFFAYLTLVFALPRQFDTMSVPVFLILMFGSLGFFIIKLVKAR